MPTSYIALPCPPRSLAEEIQKHTSADAAPPQHLPQFPTLTHPPRRRSAECSPMSSHVPLAHLQKRSRSA